MFSPKYSTAALNLNVRNYFSRTEICELEKSPYVARVIDLKLNSNEVLRT